ncbi:MAG: hypothetical protein Q9191_006783 [Dirinaria sp. TL-2023a]
MPNLQKLVVREHSDGSATSSALTPTMINLLIALLVLVIVGILAIIALFVLRSRRTRQRAIVQQQAAKISAATTSSTADILDNYSAAPPTTKSIARTHRHSRSRLTITASPYGRNSKPVFSVSEKEILMGGERNSGSSSPVSIPEIRITFPEEEDESGKRKSGRVVVVKVSDMGSVGLEPLQQQEKEEEGLLPAYYAGQDWKELDLEMIGGLKEKTSRQ